MDQPDAGKTCSASASVFFCRGSRRLQTTTSDNLVHGRVARSLTLTNHRISSDDTSTNPSTVNIRIRPIRSRKRELRRTRRTLHTIHILHSSRTLGRILCKHARASLRLPLPDPSATILEIALSYKILRDVRSFNSALPDASMDLGPRSHSRPRLCDFPLQRDPQTRPHGIYHCNHRSWYPSRPGQELDLRHASGR